MEYIKLWPTVTVHANLFMCLQQFRVDLVTKWYRYVAQSDKNVAVFCLEKSPFRQGVPFSLFTAVSAQLEEKNTPCRPLNLLERFYERLFEILQVLKSCVFWNVVIFFLLWTSGPPFTTFTGSSSWTLVVVSKGSQHQGSPDETKDGHFPTWELWT